MIEHDLTELTLLQYPSDSQSDRHFNSPASFKNMKSEDIKQTKVLFVCMGNICRSPTADAVFRHQVKKAGLDQQIMVDSAGTHAYHIGDPPDPRAQRSALQRGYEMHDLRARAVQQDDFIEFDYILAMDRDNLAILQERCPAQHSTAIKSAY